jgi:hypothetical protein
MEKRRAQPARLAASIAELERDLGIGETPRDAQA